MTLEQIEKVDKGLLVERYEVAIYEEFGRVADFMDMTIEEMIIESRAASLVVGQMHEIAPEYDFEMEFLDLIRSVGGLAFSYRTDVGYFVRENESLLADLDLDETFDAIFRWRYADQPTMFEFGHNPNATKQRSRWVLFSKEELELLQIAMDGVGSEPSSEELVERMKKEIRIAFKAMGDPPASARGLVKRIGTAHGTVSTPKEASAENEFLPHMKPDLEKQTRRWRWL